jgi:hypothetical protein
MFLDAGQCTAIMLLLKVVSEKENLLIAILINKMQ